MLLSSVYHCSPEVGGAGSSVPLLTCCIPQLELNFLSININSAEFKIDSYNKRSRYQVVLLEEHKLKNNISIFEHACMMDLSLPIVEVNVGLKLSSVNLTRIEVFPTLLSPIRSNLNSTSYLLPMVECNNLSAEVWSPRLAIGLRLWGRGSHSLTTLYLLKGLGTGTAQ